LKVTLTFTQVGLLSHSTFHKSTCWSCLIVMWLFSKSLQDRQTNGQLDPRCSWQTYHCPSQPN